MSERPLLTHHEHQEALLPSPERQEALPTAAEAEALRPGESDPLKRLEQARSHVEQTAATDNPLEKHIASEKATSAPEPTHVNHELKQITLNRELNDIRRKLVPTDRVLSRVIHQPVVRAVSQKTAQSVSRPSGLLGGGVLAFIGCGSYLYFTRHIGLQYNYFVFILLFILGFGLGLVLELIIWSFTFRGHSDS